MKFTGYNILVHLAIGAGAAVLLRGLKMLSGVVTQTAGK